MHGALAQHGIVLANCQLAGLLSNVLEDVWSVALRIRS
jgi:hypothetical protein